MPWLGRDISVLRSEHGVVGVWADGLWVIARVAVFVL